MAELPASKLPANCLMVVRYEWTFAVHVIRKNRDAHQRWCRNLAELVDFVNYCQVFCQDGPVFLKQGHSMMYAPFSYEQALAISKE